MRWSVRAIHGFDDARNCFVEATSSSLAHTQGTRRGRRVYAISLVKCSSLILLFAVLPLEAAHVVTSSGRQINGSKISAAADGSVVLTTASGQKMTFRKGQYRRAVADKPRELAQAEKLLEDGKGGQAVALLEKVKSDYSFLAWDQRAIALLGDYYYGAGKFDEAAAEFQALENPDAAAQEKYRDALIQSGKVAAVLPALEKDIASGSREAAARAYLLRGDLKAAGGDTESARRDWLKVATFFKAQKELAKNAEEKLLNSEGVEK